MNQQEFLDTVWRLEKILMHRDHLQDHIGKCRNLCDEEDDGLCPDCCEALKRVQAEDQRLAKDRE
jgi:hypothetical protein